MDFKKNFEKNNFEIRVHILGDVSVGKRSLLSRFKSINSTKTIEKLDSFIKFFAVSDINLSFRFYNILNPEAITFDDNLNEDSEFVNKTLHLNFSNVINQIRKYLDDEPILPNSFINNIFLFVYDLSNSQSLSKTQMFYEEITKATKIDKDNFIVLIGNKLDKKIKQKEENLFLNMFMGTVGKRQNEEDLDKDLRIKDINLISNENLRDIKKGYYEISTKNFFNIQRFIERVFFDFFEKTHPVFSSNIFKEYFKIILEMKSNFSKVGRKMDLNNNSPSPFETAVTLYSNEEDGNYL